MLSQVALSGISMRGIDPVYLREAAQRVAQMREVDATGAIMVWQVTDLLPVGSDLNDRKGGIGERIDVAAGPLLRTRRPGRQGRTD
jgi:hypothetical protein